MSASEQMKKVSDDAKTGDVAAIEALSKIAMAFANQEDQEAYYKEELKKSKDAYLAAEVAMRDFVQAAYSSDMAPGEAMARWQQLCILFQDAEELLASHEELKKEWKEAKTEALEMMQKARTDVRQLVLFDG